jgi:hypothetical protein
MQCLCIDSLFIQGDVIRNLSPLPHIPGVLPVPVPDASQFLERVLYAQLGRVEMNIQACRRQLDHARHVSWINNSLVEDIFGRLDTMENDSKQLLEEFERLVRERVL